MKAILFKSFGPPENLVLEEVDDLKPGEGEALVEVYAAALNFPDTLQIEGKYQWEHPFPFTPGSEAAGFPVRETIVGLFADQEIKLIQGPLFVNHPYRLEREVVALSESRRVESQWTLTRVYDEKTGELVAECLLNSASLKNSYANYQKETKRFGKVLETS